ncbi:MAG: prolipoprotein diacylglyceryl transferase, partial [Candidatus Kerfeldbacteria bacterium]|nr:prolipoprotein diacylglyceryl transferase [Candidatus Kerfeldbacteria bacterium]
WGIPIDAAHRPLHLGPYFHPTFLYESIGDLIIFLLLLAMHRWSKLRRISGQPGNIVLTYFTLYSLLRIGVESLRIDRVPIIAGIRLPLLTSLVIIGLVIITFFTRSRHTNAHA